jgi:hypothetical protein
MRLARWRSEFAKERQNSIKHSGLSTQPDAYPSSSLFVPVVEHGDLVKKLFGNLWLAR